MGCNEATRRVTVGEGWGPDELERALPPGLTLHRHAPRELRVTYLDSFDWRLDAAGVRLWVEADGAFTLCCDLGAEPPVVVPVATSPRFAADLPAGVVAHRVGALLGVRALLPVGELAVVRTELALRDPAGDTRAHLRLERLQPLGCDGQPVGATEASVVVLPIPGGDRALRAIASALDGGEADAADPLALAAAARGRSPGDYRSKPRVALDPAQPAVEAARAVLAELLETVERNVAGTVDDLDTEFLHDLRVAVRRSRSLISQLDEVLSPSLLAPAVAELRWLGELTGPLRDLDVFLLALDGHRAQLPAAAAAALAPFEHRLGRIRRAEQRRVARALTSRRCRAFLARWGEALRAGWPANDAPERDRPVADVAGERILRARRRVVKRGRRLGGRPEATALHRLRIAAKKLRYLLELFRSLFPEREIAALVRQLKKLQDVLGECNDLEVEHGQIAKVAVELVADGVDPSTLLAMGRLQALLEGRQRALRDAFAERFAAFDSGAAAATYREICTSRGRR